MPQLSLPNMPQFTFPDLSIPALGADATTMAKGLAGVVKDATYVVIGAGVLGFQQAQVRRNELRKRLSEPKSSLEELLAGLRTDLNAAIHSVDAKVEELIERVEVAVGPLEDHLPSQARDLAHQVHVQAREARTQVRNLISSAAV